MASAMEANDGKLDITMERGSLRPYPVWIEDQHPATGLWEPRNLTGYAAEFAAGNFVMSTANGRAVISELEGKIVFTPEWTGVAFEHSAYHVKIFHPQEGAERILHGVLTLI